MADYLITASMRSLDEPTTQVALMYQFADQLKAAHKTLELIRTGCIGFDELVDEKHYLGDLDSLAMLITQTANGWQDEIDRAPEPGDHWSDCATHNEPAMPNGPCDCGVLAKQEA